MLITRTKAGLITGALYFVQIPKPGLKNRIGPHNTKLWVQQQDPGINTFNDLPAFIGLTPASFETENQKAVWDLFTEEWLPTVKYARQLRDPAVKQGLEDALAAVAAGDKTPEEGMQMVQDAYDSTSK